MAESENGVTPTAFSKRSFLYRTLLTEGASFREVNGAALAQGYGDGQERETSFLREMSICDLSPLSRTGFKGKGVQNWLHGQGVAIGGEDNRAYPQPDGALAVRLAPTEALILGELSTQNELCSRLDGDWSIDTAPDCYLVPRGAASYWFLITGQCAAAMFAKLCGVDLRPHKFPVNTVAQTSVARSEAIIIRCDLERVPAFHLLGDSASAIYIWDCLRDAMEEFGGKPLGMSAVHHAIGM